MRPDEHPVNKLHFSRDQYVKAQQSFLKYSRTSKQKANEEKIATMLNPMKENVIGEHDWWSALTTHTSPLNTESDSDGGGKKTKDQKRCCKMGQAVTLPMLYMPRVNYSESPKLQNG